MEEKIYNRQVTKLSLSCRVVDVQQIERHYTNNDLSELYKFEPNTSNEERTLNLPKDRLLREIFLKYKKCVENYHEHDSLLENKVSKVFKKIFFTTFMYYNKLICPVNLFHIGRRRIKRGREEASLVRI